MSNDSTNAYATISEHDTQIQETDNEYHVVSNHESGDYQDYDAYDYYQDGDYVDGNDDYAEHKRDYTVSLHELDFNAMIAEANNYVALRNTLEDYNETSTFTKAQVFEFLNSYRRTQEFEQTIDEFMNELVMESNRHNLYVILCEYCDERLRYDIDYVRILQFRNDACENVKLALREKISLEREKIKNELNSVSHINGIKNIIGEYAM